MSLSGSTVTLTTSMGVSTDSSGNIVAQSGHYPYGESWYETGGANKLKFTSYERDSETGNDYAMFRSHIPRLGRFNRPDPIAGSIATSVVTH
ncbi:MAG: RHS repeat-associated core domain-containing protein [Candidatus Acidiferrales bacterium]